MHRSPITLLMLALTLLAAACGGGDGSTASPGAAGQTIGSGINSTQTGLNYELSIHLPAGYDQGNRRYPVVYLMDAESRFAPSLTVLQQSGVDAILVGIGNRGSARRFIDFQMPGAAPYYRFLTLELIPSIDAQFRTDPAARALSGHSLSGLLVMYALFMEPPGNRHFSSFISEDGSMFEQPAILYDLEQQMFSSSAELPVTLAMSADSTGNLANVLPLCQRIRQRGYAGIKLEMLAYTLGHVPMDVPAFGDALRFVFGLGNGRAGQVLPCT